MTVFLEVLKNNKVLAVIFFVTLSIYLVGLLIGFFAKDTYYDKIVHFLLPATGAPLGYGYLKKVSLLPTAANTAGGMLVIFILAVTGEAIWEVFEFTLDYVFGLNWQYGNFDTMTDIILAVMGGAAGALWYAYRPESVEL